MKKISFFIGFLFTFFTSSGQVPTPGSYVTNSNVDQLVGTWKWVSGQDIVEIKLQKIRHTIFNYDEDVLLGTHKYIKNGVEIQNSMAEYNNIPGDHTKATVLLGNARNSSKDFIGRLSDLTTGHSNDLTVVFTAGNPPTLLWNLKTAEKVTIDPNFQYYTITLPAQITLIKQ